MESMEGQHVHCLAADVEERLDVEVVGCQDDLEEHLLVDLDELGVPVRDVGCASARLLGVICGCGRVAAVVRAVLEDLLRSSRTAKDEASASARSALSNDRLGATETYLLQDVGRHVGKGNWLFGVSDVCECGVREQQRRRSVML
jgi:hypothetical protein